MLGKKKHNQNMQVKRAVARQGSYSELTEESEPIEGEVSEEKQAEEKATTTKKGQDSKKAKVTKQNPKRKAEEESKDEEELDLHKTDKAEGWEAVLAALQK